MASNLACIGLEMADANAFNDLVSAVLPQAAPLGPVGDIEILRWEDPSGARLIFGVRQGSVVDFLPSLSSHSGIRLGDLAPANDDVVTAKIVDDDGEQVTSAAFELEQRR